MAKGKVGLGRRGELLAARTLKKYGFKIVTQNWHCPDGEVDLVACRDKEWYFVEVRTRRGTRYGTPEESVTPHKRARMEAVARRYLCENVAEDDVGWHLSFVAVGLDRRGHLERITVYPDLESAPLRE
jgi:putative endonuclease